ncbi:MAG: 30S ribosomal protein S16 [Chloroflexi bacterium]|nr:30S ribosomal protein S16 [Chloroflexota bacterium]
MPVRIRLRRMGAKKQPSYRVVIADSKAPRDGAFLETVGHYNPLTEPPTIRLDAERLAFWLARGAQPTEPVFKLLKKSNTLQKLPQLQAIQEPPKESEE